MPMLLIFTPYEPTINGLEARCARILCAKKPVTHKVTCALSRTSCASLVVASPFFLSFYSHFKDKLSTQSASTASFHYFRQPPPPHPTTRHNKHIHIYYSHVLDTFRIRSRSQHLFTRGSSLPSRVRHRGHQGNLFSPYSVRKRHGLFFSFTGTGNKRQNRNLGRPYCPFSSIVNQLNTALTSHFTLFLNDMT